MCMNEWNICDGQIHERKIYLPISQTRIDILSNVLYTIQFHKKKNNKKNNHTDEIWKKKTKQNKEQKKQ